MKYGEWMHFIAELPRAQKLAPFLACTALFLTACDSNTPYHEVTVGAHQTMDDIGEAECGPSLFGITKLSRRNNLRMFNDLDSDSVHLGQHIMVPDDLCYRTGDKVRD